MDTEVFKDTADPSDDPEREMRNYAVEPEVFQD